jgi:hypothetical protein
MSSKKTFELLDLERDIPTTPEDVAALRRNRPPADPDILRHLDRLRADRLPGAPPRPRRKTFGGCEPFEL